MSLKVSATTSDEEKHEYDINALVYKNGKVYSAADDGKIKVWSPELKFLQEVQAHPCSIYSMTPGEGNVIYTCSSDGSVRSWDSETLKEGRCIRCPGDQEMWKCYWGDDTLAVVDDQGVVTLFDKLGNAKTIIEMMEQIKDIAYKDKLLYTVRDLDLVVTEILPGEKNRYTCRCTMAARAPLVIVGNRIISSSRDGREIFVNYRNEHQFEMTAHIKNAHELIINTLSGCERNSSLYIYSAGWDKNVKQWRLVSGGAEPAGVVDVGGYVNALCVSQDGTTVYAGGADGRIWRIDVQ